MINKSDKRIIYKIDKLIESDVNYFSYMKVRKKDGIHSLAKYPATMVPEMQKDIIDIIIESTEVKSILDPFMGSGTVLVESIRKGLDTYGLDLNPYAYLISFVKTRLKILYVN